MMTRIVIGASFVGWNDIEVRGPRARPHLLLFFRNHRVAASASPDPAADGYAAGKGGDAEVIDKVRPVFAAYSETVHHLGAVGPGYRAKLIHNFIAQANAAVLAEAFGTAAAVGLDLSAFADVCRLSGAYSKTFDLIIPFVLDGDDSGQRFALRNAAKDMRSYGSLVASYASTAIVADAVRQLYLLANNLGHGDKFVPHLFDVLGELSGVAVRAASL